MHKLALLALLASPAALADPPRFSKETIKKMQEDAVRTICNDGSPAMKAASGKHHVVLAGCQNVPRGLVVEGDFLYWANERGGEIMRMPRRGKPPERVVADQAWPAELALSKSHLYWVNGGRPDNKHLDGAVMRMPKAGGAPEVIANEQPRASSILIAGETLFWTTGGVMGRPGTVMRARLDGSEPELIASGGNYGRLTRDASQVWFTDMKGPVGKVAIAGGKAEIVATDLWTPLPIVVRGGAAFVGVLNGPAIHRIAPDGAPAALVETGRRNGGVQAMAADERHLYFTVPALTFPGEGYLYRVPLAGGQREELLRGSIGASAMLVEGGVMYLSDAVTGTVVRVELR